MLVNHVDFPVDAIVIYMHLRPHCRAFKPHRPALSLVATDPVVSQHQSSLDPPKNLSSSCLRSKKKSHITPPFAPPTL